jgi:hypothetical protein
MTLNQAREIKRQMRLTLGQRSWKFFIERPDDDPAGMEISSRWYVRVEHKVTGECRYRHEA